MKNSYIVGLSLVYCTFCAMMAPAAVLIEPVQGSTRLYSGSPGYAATVVFTMTMDLKAINNGIRITKVAGLTMDLNCTPCYWSNRLSSPSKKMITSSC